MLLKIKRDTLLKPLMLTTGFVERKQILSILSNVYLKKVGNNLTLIANDMEIQASIVIQTEMDVADFTITLPGKKLQDILKAFPDNNDIIFETQDGKVLIKSKKTKFTIQSLDAESYPLLKITENELGKFTLSQSTLKKFIGQIQYAMADKDSRVFLNGMLLEIKNNQLNLVATDAHRLGFIHYDIGSILQNHNTIIPRKTILELSRLLDDSEEPVTIQIYPHQVIFETANKQLITKVIDGKYPDYDRVIPLHNDKLCLIKREELLKAVERVAVIGIDKLKTLTFMLNHNLLNISCKNEDQEESYDEIEVNYNYNEPLKLSFNINYVRDLLSNCQAEYLQWAFFDAQRSVLVTIPENNVFKSVIMPLRA